MQTTYEAALAKVNAASAAFRQVTADYRARKITDAEFLAARAEYKNIEAEFDAAHAVASA